MTGAQPRPLRRARVVEVFITLDGKGRNQVTRMNAKLDCGHTQRMFLVTYAAIGDTWLVGQVRGCRRQHKAARRG